MAPELRYGFWIALLFAVFIAGFYAVAWLRKRLFSGTGEEDDEEDVLYTTAQLDRLKKEGMLTDEQYEKLKAESLAAAKRRAQRAHERLAARKRH